ncbi:MAG: enoyl-CoA hydratase/isomerase family protein [Deltaproteobacteria bacterium]|nr:enoyl-CoA hydratase/isomerase family protein [Candidatus Zymogenaceae bacterium]
MSDYGVRLDYTGTGEHIGLVTLDRPDKRNAFDEAMWASLEDTIERIKQRLPRAVVVTGAGDRAFSAGFDISPENPQVTRLITALGEKDRKPIEELIYRIRYAADGLVGLPVPVIAAVNGLAYGGGAELAVRCDMRVMDADAVISFSEVRLGLMPDWGGGVALSRLVGRARAAEMILTGKKVSADEALAMGLVNRVTEKGRAIEEALEIAESITKNGPRAVREALSVIRKTPDMPMAEALDFESERAVALIESGECVEGIGAFLGKREPEFKDG